MSYSERIVEYFERTTHIGSLPEDDLDVGTGLVGAPSCGDVMKLHVRIRDGKILEVRYKTFGCMAAIASSACMAEMLEGMSVDEAAKITNEDVARYLGLPIVKLHCSCLVAEVLQAAIKNHAAKNSPEGALPIVEQTISDSACCVDQGAGCGSATACCMTDSASCCQSDDTTSGMQIKSVSAPVAADREVGTQLFSITKAAAGYLISSGAQDFLADVKYHGCAGISYTIRKASEDELSLEHVTMHGVRIFAHPTSSLFLTGVIMDCEDGELVFYNPHEAKKCKCGAAFYTE